MQRRMEEEYSESRRDWATYEIAVLWLLIITKAIWRTVLSRQRMLRIGDALAKEQCNGVGKFLTDGVAE